LRYYCNFLSLFRGGTDYLLCSVLWQCGGLVVVFVVTGESVRPTDGSSALARVSGLVGALEAECALWRWKRENGPMMRWRSDHTAAGAGGSIMHCCSLFVAWNGKWGEFEEGSLHYFLPSSKGMISSRRRAVSIDIPVNVARDHFSLLPLL